MSDNFFWKNEDDNIHYGTMLVTSNNSYAKQHTNDQLVSITNDNLNVTIQNYPTTSLFNERLLYNSDYNAALDFSVTSGEFEYNALNDYTFVTRLSIYIETGVGTEHPADRYGTIVGGLTNGITINYGTLGAISLNLEAIQTLGDWLSLADNYTFLSNTTSNVASKLTIDFAKITTNGIQLNTSDTFKITLNDDFSTLNQHFFTIQGYILTL